MEYGPALKGDVEKSEKERECLCACVYEREREFVCSWHVANVYFVTIKSETPKMDLAANAPNASKKSISLFSSFQINLYPRCSKCVVWEKDMEGGGYIVQTLALFELVIVLDNSLFVLDFYHQFSI